MHNRKLFTESKKICGIPSVNSDYNRYTTCSQVVYRSYIQACEHVHCVYRKSVNRHFLPNKLRKI